MASPKTVKVLQMLLDRGEVSGVEIVELSKGEVGLGTVYVTLRRMIENELVAVRTLENDLICRECHRPRIPRQLYKITARGVRVLKASEKLAEAKAS